MYIQYKCYIIDIIGERAKEELCMTILDIFSWLPEKELSLEEIEYIVKDIENGITHDGYSVEHQLPEGEARDRLMKKYPCYTKGLIPKDVYNTANDTQTAAVMNIMLVSEKLSDEIVYDIMDGINKNVATIQASHKTAAKNIVPDFYLRAKPIPFHPGAVKWYKDHGYKF